MRTLPDAVRGKSLTMRSSSGHFWRARPVPAERVGDVAQFERVTRHREAHHRARVLAQPVVGRGDDRDLRDLREQRDRFLDLRGREVLAAADDHVLHPIGDGEETVAIEHAHVAAAVPAVGVERLGRERGVGVADAELGPTRPDLARRSGRDGVAVLVEHPDLDSRQRGAVGAVPLLGRVVERCSR